MFGFHKRKVHRRLVIYERKSFFDQDKDLEDRNLLQNKSLKLENITNEKMSKRRIQITDLQKQEIEEKEEK